MKTKISKFLLTQIHPSWGFYAMVCGALAGVAVGIFWNLTFSQSSSLVIIGIAVFLLCLKFCCRLTLSLIFLVGILLGNFRVSQDLLDQAFMQQFYNQTVLITGSLTDDPDEGKIRLSNLWIQTNSNVPVKNFLKTVDNSVDKTVENLTKSGDFQKVAGTLYVTLSSKNEDLERSDRVLLHGKLSEGFGTFVGKMSRPKLLLIERSDPGDIFVQFKHWFAERVREFIPSPQVDLGLGYLMGMKSGLAEDFAEALQLVGMTHVVVASGAHLAILTSGAKKIFGKISKFVGLLFSLLLIGAFVCVVGFTPSMTRAALVASLSLLVGYVGRKFTPLRLIFLVAFLTLLINPMNLLNLGWQLSFASFFGILVMTPRLQKTFYGGKNPPWLASMIITSLSTCLICAPILIYNFGSLSLLSFVANLIILPTLPYAMLGVMLTGVTSFLPMVANIAAKTVTMILDLHIWLVSFLSEKTMFILEIPASDVRIFLFYILILGFLIWPTVRKLVNSSHQNKPTVCAGLD